MQKMNLIINKNTIGAFLSLLLYKIVLDLSYYFLISKIWAYNRLVLNFNGIKLLESFLLLSIIFALMPKSSKKLSNIMVWLLILLSYVPMLTLFAFMNQPRSYMYAITGFWVLVPLLLKLPGISILSLKKSQSKIIYYSLFISLFIVVLFLIYKYIGFSINFDLMKVYDFRSIYVELKIPFAGYVFTWMANIINPVFFLIFILRKKWIFATMVVALQILLFSVTGNKTFFFALLYIFILIFIMTRKNSFTWMTIGLAIMILVGMLSYWLADNLWILNLFVRRTLFTPAQLSFFYYDFFSKNQFTFLSQHRLFRIFLDYPYHLNPAHLIADIYFNRPQMGANNGIYADAYMNFGFIGLVLWGGFLAILLKLYNSISNNKDIKITIAAVAMPVMSLTNSAFLTCLLTHGILLSLIVLYLLPKERNKIM